MNYQIIELRAEAEYQRARSNAAYAFLMGEGANALGLSKDETVAAFQEACRKKAAFWKLMRALA